MQKIGTWKASGEPVANVINGFVATEWAEWLTARTCRPDAIAVSGSAFELRYEGPDGERVAERAAFALRRVGIETRRLPPCATECDWDWRVIGEADVLALRGAS